MNLSIDRHALAQVEREHAEAHDTIGRADSTEEERSAAAERLKMTPKRVLEVVCRCVRVMP